MSFKNCNKCKELKPFSDFSKNKNSDDGYHRECKHCSKIRNYAYIRTRKGLIARIYRDQVFSSKQRGHVLPAYSRQELRNWCYNNVDFDRLYLNWINSGYDTMKSPSIDRKDDYKPYTFDNLLRICTWQENYDRGQSDRRNGINNKVSKAVIQMALDGEYIDDYHSIKHASRVVGCCPNDISRCCRGALNTVSRFKWKWRDD